MWVDLTREELHQIEMTCETSAECYRVIAKALKDRNYAANIQQVEQEPVAWKDLTYGNLHHQNFGNSTPLYAAPVRTKDLTDDEIAEAVGSPLDEVYLADFRAVIAADREKNR